MKKKKCSKCKKLKPLDEFHKQKASPDGHMYTCKTCARKRNRQNYLDSLSPEQLKKYKLREKRKKLLKEGKYICSKCNEIKPLTEFYKDSQHFHGHGYVCKDCQKKQNKKWYSKMKQDPEWIKDRNERSKQYHRKMRHSSEWVEHRNEQRRKRRNNKKDNPRYKLNDSIASNIRHSLKGNKNGSHWENLVGYTLDELREHLKKQFTDEMSWENYGKYWHLDHVIPISAWNYTKPEHIGFKKCWALDNLQPLEAKENLSKHNKLIKPKQEYLAI